ncbi:MAG: alpha/beta hydrolase [Lachnospiraceae bacterium]|nr:alpha/beta hydrolase [Lachnospiraceae bacterium]
MKRTGRKAVMVILLLISALLLLFLIWCLMSSGRIRTYDGEKSLSEKFVMDINGSPNGFFINSLNTDNPVLLFVSSGPGTDDYFLNDKYKDMKLEEDFTVVYWDYRDMGIAYDKSYDTGKITLENILKDTEAVTEYLKTRFGKDKIFIMGFSGGTHISLLAAREHPEDYYALINMAQVVTDGPEQDALMYDFMKRIFMDRGDSTSLKKLEESVEKTEDEQIICKDWYNYVALLHKAGGGTIKDKSEFEGIVLPIMLSRCYTVKEKLQYVPAMKMYRKTPLAKELDGFDYRVSVTSLEIPVYFISGENDYNCPWELVEEYCDIIDAPDKGFFLIPDSAHSPLWENASVTCDVLRQIKEKTDNE